MDLMLLRAFQEQVAYSCRTVLYGRDDVVRGMQGASEGVVDFSRVWYGVQNVVLGAGNVSKALWGTGRTAEERKRRYNERLVLRESLDVTDASPLRQVTIRNDLEHIDERLEKWWAESKYHNRVGMLIGPRSGSIAGQGFEDTSVLRWFDPETGDVIFWGNELNVPLVVEEVEKLLLIAEGESTKPHWEPPPSMSGGGQ